MKLGTYYTQSFQSGDQLHFYPMSYCKNGSAKGVLIDMSRRGSKRAKLDSMPPSFWHLWTETESTEALKKIVDDKLSGK